MPHPLNRMNPLIHRIPPPRSALDNRQAAAIPPMFFEAFHEAVLLQIWTVNRDYGRLALEILTERLNRN